MSFEVKVELTNPGQFFACCGLFELASRLDRDAAAAFRTGVLAVESSATLDATTAALCDGSLISDPESDASTAPIDLRARDISLRIDWWTDRRSGGARLKTWAGQQRVGEIAREMQRRFRELAPHGPDLFERAWVASSAAEKTEPFYFDSRRGANANAREVGFSADAIGLLTGVCPAVELLALIGIQRFRPAEASRGMFRYRAWTQPLSLAAASAVVSSGEVPCAGPLFQFENWARSGYYKAFLQAVPVSRGD